VMSCSNAGSQPMRSPQTSLALSLTCSGRADVDTKNRSTDLTGSRAVNLRRFALDDAQAELLPDQQRLGPPSPFWKTRAWWKRAGRTAIAVYVSTVLAFVGTAVVARGLGPQAFGEVVLAIAVATLIAT